MNRQRRKILTGIKVLCLVFTTTVLLLSCSTTKAQKSGQASSLSKAWADLNIELQYHTGLAIYDLSKDKWVFNHRDDNFFTPASNIKMLTMYATLQYLEENVPAAFYQIRGDTMVFWGGGDPGTLYPDITASTPFIDFLKATSKKIIFSDGHFDTERFGTGWAWDDYPYSYQTERTAFPIYGNRLWIDRYVDSLVVTPKYFELVTTIRKSTIDTIGRDEEGTHYFYDYTDYKNEEHLTIPVSLFKNDIRFIWQEATGKEIQFESLAMPRNTMRIDGTSRDTLLKYMMQESDNFIAEQLLLTCALRQTGRMDETTMIKKILDGPLAQLPDKITWVDGSGLSRYNLLTPRSAIFILRKIIDQKGIDYVKSIFPAGGQSGTIADWYINPGKPPYVYAKTGTLDNAHCLTGILITDSGKILLFSWMNNQYNAESYTVKRSMEKLFTWLRDNY